MNARGCKEVRRELNRHGETAATATPERAGTLTCAPKPPAPTRPPTGPAPTRAASGGDLDALTARADVLCTKQYEPVVVTIDGGWQGRRVSHERTFTNGLIHSAE